jgi:hypothetical protein
VNWVLDLDVRSFFTTIPHDKLIILIKQRVVDGSMLRLIYLIPSLASWCR